MSTKRWYPMKNIRLECMRCWFWQVGFHVISTLCVLTKNYNTGTKCYINFVVSSFKRENEMLCKCNSNLVYCIHMENTLFEMINTKFVQTYLRSWTNFKRTKFETNFRNMVFPYKLRNPFYPVPRAVVKKNKNKLSYHFLDSLRGLEN